jgi:hypothetical protein
LESSMIILLYLFSLNNSLLALNSDFTNSVYYNIKF